MINLPADREYRGLCKYANGKCQKERTLKRCGSVHSLCEKHRQLSCINQRKLDRKRKMQKAKREAQSARSSLKRTNDLPFSSNRVYNNDYLQQQQLYFNYYYYWMSAQASLHQATVPIVYTTSPPMDSGFLYSPTSNNDDNINDFLSSASDDSCSNLSIDTIPQFLAPISSTTSPPMESEFLYSPETNNGDNIYDFISSASNDSCSKLSIDTTQQTSVPMVYSKSTSVESEFLYSPENNNDDNIEDFLISANDDSLSEFTIKSSDLIEPAQEAFEIPLSLEDCETILNSL